MATMRVLITGGAGFIGSHLAELLLSRGSVVTVLDNLSTGSRRNVSHLEGHPAFRLVLGDACDPATVAPLAAAADQIFHLAAAVGVELVVRKPCRSLLDNIRSVEVVMGEAERHGCRLLFTSSSEIYGKSPTVPLREDGDRVLGATGVSRWAYSTSKAVGEILGHYYWREFGLPAVTVRLFNTVGPRQTGAYGMVIPRFVRQALRGECLSIHGDGTQSRCFLHVLDTVRALADLAECPAAVGQVVNVGGVEEVTIDELARRIVDLTGSASETRRIPYDQAYEVGFEDMPRRIPDVSRLCSLIGFRPTRGLDAILQDVINWERAVADDPSAR